MTIFNFLLSSTALLISLLAGLMAYINWRGIRDSARIKKYFAETDCEIYREEIRALKAAIHAFQTQPRPEE